MNLNDENEGFQELLFKFFCKFELKKKQKQNNNNIEKGNVDWVFLYLDRRLVVCESLILLVVQRVGMVCFIWFCYESYLFDFSWYWFCKL